MVSIDLSSFTENVVEEEGGGIDNQSDGAFSVTRSTIAGNRATQGGGLNSGSDAAFIVESTTISGNTATISAGGLLVGDPITLSNSTVANNSAPAGGGLEKVADSRQSAPARPREEPRQVKS